jgi:hypothetical protein
MIGIFNKKTELEFAKDKNDKAIISILENAASN